MSKFVNLKKRGISLPPGCKELIDLLEPARRKKANEFITPRTDVKVTRDDTFIGKLSDIGKPISAALESKARVSTLTLDSLDDQLSLGINRMETETLSTSVTFTQSPENERKMKAIFERSGLQVPHDSGVPGHFLKGHPVQLIYPIFQSQSKQRI